MTGPLLFLVDGCEISSFDLLEKDDSVIVRSVRLARLAAAAQLESAAGVGPPPAQDRLLFDGASPLLLEKTPKVCPPLSLSSSSALSLSPSLSSSSSLASASASASSASADSTPEPKGRPPIMPSWTLLVKRTLLNWAGSTSWSSGNASSPSQSCHMPSSRHQPWISRDIFCSRLIASSALASYHAAQSNAPSADDTTALRLSFSCSRRSSSHTAPHCPAVFEKKNLSI